MNREEEEEERRCSQCSVSEQVSILYPIKLEFLTEHTLLLYRTCLIDQLIEYECRKRSESEGSK